MYKETAPSASSETTREASPKDYQTTHEALSLQADAGSTQRALNPQRSSTISTQGNSADKPDELSGLAHHDEQLKYWTAYQNQLHCEIQKQLAEMTRYTHLKLLILGSLLLLAKGKMALLIFGLLPFALLTLDIMHSLRFGHIFDRWRYLEEVVDVELTKLLGKEVKSFASTVMTRHRSGRYQKPNEVMRTLTFAPSLLFSSLAIGTVVFGAFDGKELVAHGMGILWCLIIVFYVSKWHVDLYRKGYLFIVLGILGCFVLGDYLVRGQSVHTIILILTRSSP